MAMSFEVRGVDGSPSVIQASKCGDDLNDRLKRVGDLLGIEVVMQGVLHHCGLKGLLVRRLGLKVLPRGLVRLLRRLFIHLNFLII